MFNPHTWPPNLEGVRGSPTATELITIDRQLFYDAMWRIWSFHPTIMRTSLIIVPADSHYHDVVTPPPPMYHPQRRMCLRFMWEVRTDRVSPGWEEVKPCLALQVTRPSLHYYGHYDLQTSRVVVMSCWCLAELCWQHQHLLTVTRGRPDGIFLIIHVILISAYLNKSTGLEWTA